MNMEHYQIIWGDSTSDLSEKVNKELKYGWLPLGGICQATAITLGIERYILIQAMVRMKKE